MVRKPEAPNPPTEHSPPDIHRRWYAAARWASIVLAVSAVVNHYLGPLLHLDGPDTEIFAGLSTLFVVVGFFGQKIERSARTTFGPHGIKFEEPEKKTEADRKVRRAHARKNIKVNKTKTADEVLKAILDLETSRYGTRHSVVNKKIEQPKSKKRTSRLG